MFLIHDNVERISGRLYHKRLTTTRDPETVGKCRKMGDTLSSSRPLPRSSAPPTLLLLIAAREFRRHARAGSPALDRNDRLSRRATSAAPDAPLEIKHLA